MGKKALVKIVLDDDSVTIVPRGIWRLWSFSRGQRIPFESLTDVQVSSRPLVEFPTGVRVAGLDVVAFLAGHFRNSGQRSWWCYRNGQSALVIRADASKVATFVVSAQDNESFARQLQARLVARSGYLDRVSSGRAFLIRLPAQRRRNVLRE